MPLVEDISPEFGRAFLQETDRGCVLLAVSLLDETVGELLAAYMPERPGIKKVRETLLKGALAPLRSFYARIEAAYAFDLIPAKMRTDLHGYRSARNLMAHRYQHLHFDHPEIMKHLRFPRLTAEAKAELRAEGSQSKPGKRRYTTTSARVAFIQHAWGLMTFLNLAVEMLKKGANIHALVRKWQGLERGDKEGRMR